MSDTRPPFLRQLGCTTDNTAPALAVPDANKQLDRHILCSGSDKFDSPCDASTTPPVPIDQHPSGDFMPIHYGIRMPIPPMFAQWSAAQYEAERVGGVEALGRVYDDHARSLCRRAYLVRCHCLYVWLGILHADDDSAVSAVVGEATSATRTRNDVKISFSDSWAEAMNSMLSEKLEDPYTSLDLDDLFNALSARSATEFVSLEMSRRSVGLYGNDFTRVGCGRQRWRRGRGESDADVRPSSIQQRGRRRIRRRNWDATDEGEDDLVHP